MISENFDYNNFAENLSLQANNLLPNDISKENGKYLTKKMKEFVKIAGKAIAYDKSITFTAEQAELLCQILAEWTFHKTVDLIRGKIPQKYWDEILQKIAFNIFEIVKQATVKNVSIPETLKAIEFKVVDVYTDCIDELDLSSEIKEFAKQQSNIDLLEESDFNFQEISESQNEKIVENESLFSNFKKFTENLKLKKLLKIQEPISPNKMYDKLGAEVLSIYVGKNLVKIADPDKKGLLLARIAELRVRLADEFGYILPNVRIYDKTDLCDDEYQIAVRENIIDSGFAYTEKLMVPQDEYDTNPNTLPDGVIQGKEPVYKTDVYWIPEKYAKDSNNITYTNAEDVIITHLEYCYIKYIKEILTLNDINKYLDTARTNGNLSTIIDEELLTRISLSNIKTVFEKLIREKVSLKDYRYIIEKICEIAQYTQNPIVITEHLRVALSRNIISNIVDEDNILNALTLSSQFINLLNECLELTETTIKFNLNLEQKQSVIDNIANSLMNAVKNSGVQPVILASSKLRLPLYELLSFTIPSVVVIAEDEVIPEIEVKILGTIENC